MRMMNNRLAQAADEFLTQRPHRLGDISQSRVGIGQLLLEPIKPLVKASVELVAKSLPLMTCADLG
jgi:hypothetical protein